MILSGKRCQDIQARLFKSSISIIALANNEALKDDGRQFMIELASALGIKRLELFRQELEGQLTMMRGECHSWGSSSRRVAVFSTLLQEAESTVGCCPSLIV